MACSRSFPMNDLGFHDWNDAIRVRRQENPAGDRGIEKDRPRRRWGGRLFALGAVLFLVVGLSLGAWGQYSQQQQVMAAAEQGREFVPSVRVATIQASP